MWAIYGQDRSMGMCQMWQTEDKDNRITTGEEMTDWSSIGLMVVAVILLIIAILAIFPLVTFWAIQTLFGYHIAWNIYTSIAFWILFLLVKPSVTVNK